MADDDQSSADPGQPGSPGDPNVPEDSPEPKAEVTPESPEEKKKAEERSQENLRESRNKTYIDELEKNYYEANQRSQKMFAQLQGPLNSLMQLANAPSPQYPQTAVAPPPPTEQQKGDLSEFAMNLLKFGALTAIAFGSQGRGYGHNAIWKSAIGAALTGYAAGRKDVRDQAMQVWEKNRAVINDANNQQIDRYKAILENRKLDLSQKMDLINGLSKTFGDYRAFQASQNKNLLELQKAIRDSEKLQHDKEEWEIKHRDKIYDVLGKKNITNDYLAWLHERSGGKTTLSGNSSVDDWRKVETDHPEWSFSEFIRFHEQEEIRKATEKTRATTQAHKDVTEGKTEDKSDPEAAKKAAKILEGLVQ